MKILCVRCFEEFPAHLSLFRCDNDHCTYQEPDRVYAEKQNIAAVTMGRVLPPPSANILQMTGAQSPPLEARCLCGHATRLRICRECHYELPHDAGLVPQRVISIIGSSIAGKSHYIATLIPRIEADTRFHGQFLGEESRQRWNADFKERLFGQHRELEPTPSARINARVMTPIIYRIYSGQGNQRRILNMSFFDAAGEDMLSLDQMNNGVRQVLHAEGILFIIDPLQIEAVRDSLKALGQTRFPQFIMEAQPRVIEERLREFFERKRGVRAQQKIEIPVAFVLSKIDRLFPLLGRDSLLKSPSSPYNTFDLPEIVAIGMEIKSYLDQWIPGLTGIIDEHFKTYQFFGVSALGADPGVDKSIPEIRSIRVEDPFVWLLYQMGLVGDR